VWFPWDSCLVYWFDKLIRDTFFSRDKASMSKDLFELLGPQRISQNPWSCFSLQGPKGVYRWKWTVLMTKNTKTWLLCAKGVLFFNSLLFLGCMLVDFFYWRRCQIILMFPYHVYSLATRFSPDDHQQNSLHGRTYRHESHFGAECWLRKLCSKRFSICQPLLMDTSLNQLML